MSDGAQIDGRRRSEFSKFRPGVRSCFSWDCFFLLAHSYINDLTHDILLLPLQLGFAADAKVEGAKENDKSKEKQGFVAGKHINKETKWWFQRSKKDWSAN